MRAPTCTRKSYVLSLRFSCTQPSQLLWLCPATTSAMPVITALPVYCRFFFVRFCAFLACTWCLHPNDRASPLLSHRLLLVLVWSDLDHVCSAAHVSRASSLQSLRVRFDCALVPPISQEAHEQELLDLYFEELEKNGPSLLVESRCRCQLLYCISCSRVCMMRLSSILLQVEQRWQRAPLSGRCASLALCLLEPCMHVAAI